ncbi:hypothetical protein DH2020_013097 [Rehmannia glutinosa]|uniref:Myb-like domain-containing protein n=1 Tax=Rehmannia glutinosa TaxID=99300 RepID=A0ABR0X192_REHGL
MLTTSLTSQAKEEKKLKRIERLRNKDLLEKTPEISGDLGKNARELVSLRILESFFVQGARANPVSPASSPKIRLDPPGDSCKDILRRILTELKDAMLTGSHSFLASLKERSGLPIGNQSEHEAPVNDGTCNGITPRFEGNDTNDGNLLQRDLPDENLEVNRKRRVTSENAGERSSENLILSENGCETHTESVKKYKHDIICSEQNVGGKLISSGVYIQIADMSTESMQHSGGQRCGMGRKTHVGDVEVNEPPKDDKCTSSKGLVGPDEVLPREKQVPHCETELIKKSEVEQGQDHDIEEAKGDKEGFCDLKRINEDLNIFEQNIQKSILNVGEVEEVNIYGDTDGNNDDRTDIATKDDASFSRQYTHSQDPLATTYRTDQNLLADSSKRYSEEERCSLGKKTDVEVMVQNGPPGDGNNMCTSLKGPVGHDEVLLHEKQAPHSTLQSQNDKFDGEQGQDHEVQNVEDDKDSLHDLITTNEDMDKLEQNDLRDVPNVGEAEEDVNISTDSDWYHDERTNIDTKKKTFLSSQCTYSQDSLATTDWRELNLCMKCNLGGKLLVCSSNSCPIVIHQSCLGSDAIFDTRGEFYCPFCAYSRAISKYMEIKKKTSLARNELTTFICSSPQKGSKKQSQRSCMMKENHLEQDTGLPKSNELNKRDVVKKVSNRQRRKKLEFEQAGPSEHSPPFGRKAVDSSNRIAHTLNEDKQVGKRTRQVSQSPKVHGQHQMAAVAIRKSQGENTCGAVSERSDGSEKCVNIRSKKEMLYPPETDLPRENECSQSSRSTDAEETSEGENENSGASNSYPAIPQLRRKRLPWTSEEEDKLKEGMRLYCSPHDKTIQWKKILELGATIFHQSRSTMDLKDKWRNMCKATPKSNK